jgi:NADPH:quinone reductase-like Zn-dependent oxidoreductase
VHAAAVPLAALTAWQALFDSGQLKPGQRVLIHGGSGGVGHVAVQLAKWKGAYVLATASTKNQELLRELGVDEPIDYTKQKFEDVARDVDLLLDLIGAETQERSWSVLRAVFCRWCNLHRLKRKRSASAPHLSLATQRCSTGRCGQLIRVNCADDNHRILHCLVRRAHRSGSNRFARGKIVRGEIQGKQS